MKEKLLKVFNICLTSLLVIILLIRFIIKDSIFGFSIIYYATPLALTVILALLVAFIYHKTNQLKLSLTILAISISLLVYWLFSSYQNHQINHTNDEIKTVFWNTDHAIKGVENISNFIKKYNPDLIGVVEAGIELNNKSPDWQKAFSGYTVELLKGDMLFITTGKVLSKESGSLAGKGNYNLIKLELQNKQLIVIIVDMFATPLNNRKIPFEPLTKLIEQHKQSNLIIMGDFNTPKDSVFFNSFRTSLDHAFETTGIGFSETWPIPFPILSIDHIWVSKTIKPLACKLNYTFLSDHKMVVANFEIL